MNVINGPCNNRFGSGSIGLPQDSTLTVLKIWFSSIFSESLYRKFFVKRGLKIFVQKFIWFEWQTNSVKVSLHYGKVSSPDNEWVPLVNSLTSRGTTKQVLVLTHLNDSCVKSHDEEVYSYSVRYNETIVSPYFEFRRMSRST